MGNYLYKKQASKFDVQWDIQSDSSQNSAMDTLKFTQKQCTNMNNFCRDFQNDHNLFGLRNDGKFNEI